jgi:excisionase family DNA binding protein
MAKKAKEIEVKEVIDSPMPQLPQVDFYTLDYIEKVWNISVRYLREQIKNGSLSAYKVGKSYVVTHTDLIEYVTKVKAKD